MPKSDYPDAVLDPMIGTMRSTIEETGGCMNMAGYCRDGDLLMTLFYSYPLGPDGDPDTYKEPVTLTLARIGRTLNVDLVITVADMFFHVATIDPAKEPPVYWDDFPGGRPSEQPDRIETLFVVGYRPDGSIVPPALLPYGRDDLGRPTWRDWDSIEEVPDAFDMGGLVYDAWKQGLAESPRSLRGLLGALATVLRGGMQVMIFDPDIAAQMGAPTN